ncbi:MAG: hypothetical protein R3C30_15335 [Hyphomonadaceae bacterium]
MRMKMTVRFILALAALGACAERDAKHSAREPAGTTEITMTPDALRSMIAAEGSTATVNQLDANTAEANLWWQVLDHIAAGEDQWLELVADLKAGVDAGAAESLVISVSRALTSNPAGVLALMPNVYLPTEICSMNEVEPTEEEVATYYADAIRAVESVTNPAFQGVKTDCLRSLRSNSFG